VNVLLDIPKDLGVAPFSANGKAAFDRGRHGGLPEAFRSVEDQLAPALQLRDIEHAANLELVAVACDDNVALVFEPASGIFKAEAIGDSLDTPVARESRVSNVGLIGGGQNLLASRPPFGHIGAANPRPGVRSSEIRLLARGALVPFLVAHPAFRLTPFLAESLTFGVACFGGSAIVAGMGATSLTLHVRRHGPLSWFWLRVDAAIRKAPSRNTFWNVRSFELSVNVLLPRLAPFDEQCFVVPGAHFRTEALAYRLAKRQENMGVMISLVALFMRAMNCDIGDHTARNEGLVHERAHELFAPRVVELVRQ
jgi:hypothetical protein